MEYSMKRGTLFAVLVALVATAELMGSASAATYVVGDSLGWTVPTGGAATYSNWASQHSFAVGDVLVFNFTTGFHDVARVTRAAFDGCRSTNPITLATVGPASFTLNSTGEDHFICTFGQHCSLGQRLAINVTAASGSPAPAPGPSPPSIMPPPAPTPSPSGMPSPSPSQTPSPSPMPPVESGPSPSPSGSVTPPGSAAPGESPASTPSPPSDFPPSLTRPPPPQPPGSAANMVTFGSHFLILASIFIGLMI